MVILQQHLQIVNLITCWSAREAEQQWLQEVGAAISSSLAAGVVQKEQACFLPLSPDGTPVIGPVPGTARSLYVASGRTCATILITCLIF